MNLYLKNSMIFIWNMFLCVEGVFPWNCTHTIEDFKELDLYCSIRKDQKWGISDFRTWLSEHFRNSSVNLNDIGVNLYLNCHDSAAISLNRPIKVKGLRKLIIEGCTTLKYMVYDLSDDMYKEEDKLEVFEIVNSVHKIHVRELITLYEKEIDQKINSMYPCEHNRNLARFVERNVSEDLFGQRDLTSSEVEKLQENFQHSLYVRNTCEYSRLVYYEQSNSRQSSKNTFNAIKYMMNNSKFPVLRVFNFTNLGLTDIPSAFYKRDWWIYFKHLETLDFSNNRISTMDFEYSPFISKRTIHVNLRNNSFKIFTEEDIEKLKSFYPNTVDFRGNAFVCICENKALFSFIENNDNFGLKSSYEYLRNLKCADDKNKMKRLIDISISEICSTANQVTVNSISLVIYVSLSVFLTLIVVIVMFRFRHEIKILAHNRLKFERRMTTDNYLLKEFDAFVSYSSLDETWVVQSLCKRLESSPTHFKLCIHHKDFVPGACISDNIIQSVEKSRHTILVLSENFLKSEWCLLEFQKAFHQTLIERNRHLIIILLESVSEATLPVDMKHFLHTHTYINFTEPLFWDKLIYSLSERKRRYCCGMSMNTQAISQKHTTVGLK